MRKATIFFVLREVSQSYNTIATLQRVAADVRVVVAGDEIDRVLDQDARISPNVVLSNNRSGYPRLFSVVDGNVEAATYMPTPDDVQEIVRRHRQAERRGVSQTPMPAPSASMESTAGAYSLAPVRHDDAAGEAEM